MAANAPKTMSNRLMTMKFMQRGAAKSSPASTSQASTPGSATPSTPTGPTTKRVRLSAGGYAAAQSDEERLRQVLDEEERKRLEALERAAEMAGETKWVLSIPESARGEQEGLRVAYAGFGEIDAATPEDAVGREGREEGEADSEAEVGSRMVFGGGVKRAGGKKQTQRAQDESSDDDDSDDSDSDSGSESSYDSDDPTAEVIREAKREAAAKVRADQKEAKAKKRQSLSHSTPKRPNIIDEDMDLSGLGSLSGGRSGGLSGGGRGNMANMECFQCGQKGHIKSDCPKNRGKAGGGGGGLSRRPSGRGNRGGGGGGGAGFKGGLSARPRF